MYIKCMKITKLSHAYQFSGFKPLSYVRELTGEAKVVIVPLRRTRQKKGQIARIVVLVKRVGMTTRRSMYGTSPVGVYGYILNLIYGVFSVGSVGW